MTLQDITFIVERDGIVNSDRICLYNKIKSTDKKILLTLKTL